MIDKTTRILLEKYAPNDPRLTEVVVEKTSITVEDLLLQVRGELLAGWGLDPSGRHEFADDIVGLLAVEKSAEFNVTGLPNGGTE